MNNQSFATSILVNESPEKVFGAVLNPRGWWSEEIEGDTEKVGDEFRYHYQDVHSSIMKLTEVIPNKKVVWHVLDNHFKFVTDKQEWIGNHIIFEIVASGNKTLLRFIQEGLVPAYECYDVCSVAWTHFITESLHDLITKGKGDPLSKHGSNEFAKESVRRWGQQE